MMKSTAASWS